MTRLPFLLTALAACGYDPASTDTAVFHGTVGRVTTHVMAVSPVAGDLARVVAPTEDGAFSIEVASGRPWAFVFVDAGKHGADMVRGVLRADSLDTFVPLAGGDIDLGEISIDNHEATMAGSSDDLDTALGVSRRTLATLGGLDDLALRYANPDMDDDGVLDVEQGIAPKLEVHAEYELAARGHAATVRDFMVNPDEITYTHVGTGIYGRLPDAFGQVDRDDADVTFEQPYWGYWQGEQTAAVPAGEPVQHLTFGDDRTFGVYCRPDREVPSGTYRFRSGPHSLDFSFVRPPTQMTRNQVMPRLRLVPTVEGCQDNCKLERIEFAWLRNTDSGWVQLTDEEVAVLRPAGSLDLAFADGSGRRYDLPDDVAAGHVLWEPSYYTTTPSFASGDIAFGSLSFQTRPGMKMFARFGNDR